MLDAPWPSGFGPLEQRRAPPTRSQRTAGVGVAEVLTVEADMLPGGTVRLGETPPNRFTWQALLSVLLLVTGRTQLVLCCVWQVGKLSRKWCTYAVQSRLCFCSVGWHGTAKQLSLAAFQTGTPYCAACTCMPGCHPHRTCKACCALPPCWKPGGITVQGATSHQCVHNLHAAEAEAMAAAVKTRSRVPSPPVLQPARPVARVLDFGEEARPHK